MMENAGRGLAAVARRMLGGSAAARSVVVLVGKGNNGGGGLVAARHLATAGADVRVALAANPGELGDTPEHQRRTLERIGIWGGDCRADPDDLSPLLQGTDLVLDALIGYGLRGAPREPVADFIRAANAAPVSRLALDLPSGLDGDSGAPREPCIRATATLTLAWPKVGLLVEAARDYVGDLYLADIGVPTPVYRAVGVASGQVFARGPLVRVGRDEGTWRVITTPQMGDSFR